MKKFLSGIAALMLCTMLMMSVASAEFNPSDDQSFAEFNPSDESLFDFNAFVDQTKSTVEELTASTGTIHVNASASVNIAPDTATVSVGVQVQKKTVKEAQAQANTTVSDIIQAVKALGVEESKITTSDYSVYPQMDYSSMAGEEKVLGYAVYNSVTVKIDDFVLLDKVIDTAVEKGANQINGISFDTSQRSELYRQALTKAVGAAMEKAELLAAASGVKLVSLKDVSEKSEVNSSAYYRASNTAMDAEAAAGKAGTSIQGGELAVTAQVELTYEFKNIQK